MSASSRAFLFALVLLHGLTRCLLAHAATLAPAAWDFGESRLGATVKGSFVVAPEPGELLSVAVPLVSDPSLLRIISVAPVAGDSTGRVQVDVELSARRTGAYAHYLAVAPLGPAGPIRHIPVTGVVRSASALFHAFDDVPTRALVEHLELLRTRHADALVAVDVVSVAAEEGVRALQHAVVELRLPSFLPPPRLLLTGVGAYTSDDGIRAALHALYTGADMPPPDLAPLPPPDWVLHIYVRQRCSACAAALDELWRRAEVTYGKELGRIAYVEHDLDEPAAAQALEESLGRDGVPADVETIVVATGEFGGPLSAAKGRYDAMLGELERSFPALMSEVGAAHHGAPRHERERPGASEEGQRSPPTAPEPERTREETLNPAREALEATPTPSPAAPLPPWLVASLAIALAALTGNLWLLLRTRARLRHLERRRDA